MLKKIRIDITNNCNLRCMMCTIHDTVPKSDLKVIDFEHFKKNCKSMLPKLKHIQFGNIAEPLLHPQFDQFIRFVRLESDCEILIQTNGLLLNKYSNVINENRCMLNVSIDSLNDKTYKYIRGGNLNKLMKNLTMIDSDKVDVFMTQVLMKSNIDEFGNWVEFCKENKYRLSVVPIIIREICCNVITTNLIDESLWFSKLKLKSLKKYYDNPENDHVWAGMILNNCKSPRALNRFKCEAHHDDLIVLSNGQCQMCFQYDIGNLNEIKLEDIWFGEKANNLREDIDNGKTDICEQCDYKIACINPTIENFRNHVTKSIYLNLSAQVKELLSFDSELTDEKQKEILLEELLKSYRIYNFVDNEEKTFAIPISLGSVELTNEEEFSSLGIVQGKNQVELLNRLIEENSIITFIPKLIDSYKGHNIVRYKMLFYAIPLSLGHWDLTNENQRNHHDILSSQTQEGVKKLIDDLVDLLSK